jgi:hypothetical protein
MIVKMISNHLADFCCLNTIFLRFIEHVCINNSQI